MDQMIKLLKACAFILCILGIIEYLYGKSFYSVLQTTPREIWTGNFVRGNSYRIMGPFNHALAYGMVLVALFPVSCYDIKKEKISVIGNWLLASLIIVNIFLTGSRSTLLVLGLELVLIFLCSELKNKLKNIGIGLLVVVALAVYVNSVNNAMTQYIKTISFSIADIVFGTSLSLTSVYSASVTTGYRAGLLSLFSSYEINPLIGNGFSYSVGYSLDNNYVGIYVAAGWLGLVAFFSVIAYIMIYACSKVKTSRVKAIAISVIGYCAHLFFVNELHTISVLFILLAMLYCEISQFVLDHPKSGNRLVKS